MNGISEDRAVRFEEFKRLGVETLVRIQVIESILIHRGICTLEEIKELRRAARDMSSQWESEQEEFQ